MARRKTSENSAEWDEVFVRLHYALKAKQNKTKKLGKNCYLENKILEDDRYLKNEYVKYMSSKMKFRYTKK